MAYEVSFVPASVRTAMRVRIGTDAVSSIGFACRPPVVGVSR